MSACSGCPFKACADCPDQGDPVVDTATAAVAAGVKPATVRDWQRRGLLTPVARGRYRLADVYTARSRVRVVSSQETTQPKGMTP